MHNLRLDQLTFRSPTLAEVRAGMASASDREAQHWLGWPRNVLVPPHQRDKLLDVVPGVGPMFVGQTMVELAAVHIGSNRFAGMVTVYRQDGREPELGGHLAPWFRGRGLGVELFRAGLVLAHEHLGLPVIRAGAEDTNVRSQRALLAAGMSPADGPATHVLGNGRTIRSVWYQHEAAQVRRCVGPRPQW